MFTDLEMARSGMRLPAINLGAGPLATLSTSLLFKASLADPVPLEWICTTDGPNFHCTIRTASVLLINASEFCSYCYKSLNLWFITYMMSQDRIIVPKENIIYTYLIFMIIIRFLNCFNLYTLDANLNRLFFSTNRFIRHIYYIWSGFGKFPDWSHGTQCHTDIWLWSLLK